MPKGLYTSRDLERKCKALEADYIISNRELLVKQVEIQRLTARIAELEKENAMLKQLSQPIELWSDEKIQIYKSNESRSVKSGNEEREE